MEKHKPIVGITIGDINGIGPEIILNTLNDHLITKFCTPIIYGSTKVFNQYKKLLGAEEFQWVHIKEANQVVYKKVNIIHCWDEDIAIEPGKATEKSGELAFLSLKRAVNDLKNGFIDGLVTCPINKKNIKTSEFNFVGHTEYFQHIFNSPNAVMMMVSEPLKVAVVSMHVPLNKVAADVTAHTIIGKVEIIKNSLEKDFNLSSPKIAVLGLNPHAGDGGVIGHEEKEIIIPAINELKSKGYLVFGPFPADGFFGSGLYTKYDAVLAMYHDQGLIPFKMMAFDTGVNYTAGLPVVRTSPDHGTAYDIAGMGKADASSFREAIFTACNIIKNRVQHAATKSQ